MNTYQAQQLLTIVKYMSLSKAASELYITQPALSLALSRLESELGITFFYRVGKRLVLSEAGEKLVPLIEEFAAAHEKIQNVVREIKYSEKEKIKLGFYGSSYMFSTFYMTPFLQSYNGKIIDKIYADTETLEAMLCDKHIDVALTQKAIQNSKIESCVILREPLVLIVSSKHPLAAKDSVSLKELADVDMVGYEPSQFIRVLIDQLCESAGYRPRFVKECSYREHVKIVRGMAGTDQYATITPITHFESSFGKFVNGYVTVKISDPEISRETMLCWLKDSSTQYKLLDFMEYIKAGFAAQNLYFINYTKFAEMQDMVM